MARFAVTRAGDTVRIELDDGGMNLLSADALRELASVIPSEVEGSGRVGNGGAHHPPGSLDSARDDRGDARDDRGDARDDRGDIRVLLFASARPSLFAAGADMAEMQRFTGLDAETFSRLGQDLFARIERLPMVTVALIDGDCFGGALDLALSFDFRFATPRSRFAHPGSRIGIVTGFGGTSRWRKVLSRPAASQLFLANRVLNANDALRYGLVDRVADSHGDAIDRLATLDPAVARMVKELTIHSDRLSRHELAILAARLSAVYGR